MSFKTALVGASALAVAAAAFAPAAHAQSTTTLYGGGGTLAAKLYRDLFNCYSATAYGILATSPGNPSNVTYPTAQNAACAADQNKNVALAYEPVGSGAGLSAFTTGAPVNFGMPASTNSVAYLNTNTTVAASSTPYPEVEFAGSDAYLTSAQIAAAAAIDAPAGKTAAIFQIPTVATPITLPIGLVNGVSLSLAQVCDVFSGQATVTGSPFKTQQIYVRQDGSGTSAIFGLWLSQNCIGTGAQGKTYAFTSGNGFGSTAPTWSAADVGTLGVFSAVSGSGGIANAITSAHWSVGYVSPDYVNPVVKTSKAYPATVNGFKPTVANTATHVNAITIPTSYDNNIGETQNTELTSPSVSTSGYAIVGFTFIDTYGCYSSTYANGSIGSAAKGLLLKQFLLLLDSGFAYNTYAGKIFNAAGFVAPPTSLVNLYRSTGGPLSATGINGSQCPTGRT